MARQVVLAAWAIFTIGAYVACDDGADDVGGADTDTDTDTDTGGNSDIDGDADGDRCDPAYATPCIGFPYDDCLDGDVLVASEADVAALAGQTCVSGTVVVAAAELSEIVLPDLTAACNVIVIDNGALTTLTMENLQYVMANVCVGRNTSLTALHLPVLSYALGVVVWENGALTDLTGLPSLTSTTDLSVQGNAAMSSLDGLQQLTTIRTVDVIGNPSLVSLAGLDSLESVESSYDYLTTHLHIGENGALESLGGLSALASVGSIAIYDNGALADVALPALIEAGDLQISGNAVLPNVDGLDAVTTLGTHVAIFDNAALANLDGLGGVASLEEGGSWVLVENNPELPTCEAQGFVDQIDGFGGETCISGNLVDACPDNVTSDECGGYL